jgi:hypothetical protein
MTEEVFGIPSQTFMDMLLLVTNEGTSDPPVHRVVDHCKGIIFIAEADMPCYPVDPSKYPNWKCINIFVGSNMDESSGHHDCFKSNIPNAPIGQVAYYCCCIQAPQTRGITTHNYAMINRSAPAYCEGCATKHSKTERCPMCGEVHS